MAIIDTGLGWSADEDWLKSSTGYMGKIAGPVQLPNDIPIFHAYIETSDLVAANKYVLINGTPCYMGELIMATPYPYNEITMVCYRTSNTAKLHVVWISTTSSASKSRALNMRYANGTNYFNAATTFAVNNRDNSTGLYYYDFQLSSTAPTTAESGTVPVVASLREALDYYHGTVLEAYKLNTGYAVACFIKYQIPPGPKNVTNAILISSDPSYTAISTDGSTPYSPDRAQTIVYQGLPFTMRLLVPVENGTVSGNTVMSRDVTSAGDLSVFADLFEVVARLASITVTAPEPYGGGPNEPGGGPTEPDDTDDIPFAIPPYISASSSGFVRLFNPTLAEINALASFMWSTGFDLDTVKRVYANPIDYIIGASIVPVIPSVKTASYPISFPGLTARISSGVSMDEVYQYVTLNCGSIRISPKWNSYLDWSPYHRFSIWLPYIGFRDIDADDIMGRTIELQYVIDLLSGACNAELLCGASVLYSWQGQCGAQIPINSADWSSMLTGAISLAASAVKLGASIATGGATAASLATDIASAGTSAFNLKPSVSRGGTVAGAAGFMAQQTPYIVRTRPELALPDGQAHFIGYPSFTTVSLGAISGYAEVYSVHLHGIPATEEELSEIEQILREGVIY